MAARDGALSNRCPRPADGRTARLFESDQLPAPPRSLAGAMDVARRGSLASDAGRWWTGQVGTDVARPGPLASDAG